MIFRYLLQISPESVRLAPLIHFWKPRAGQPVVELERLREE